MNEWVGEAVLVVTVFGLVFAMHAVMWWLDRRRTPKQLTAWELFLERVFGDGP